MACPKTLDELENLLSTTFRMDRGHDYFLKNGGVYRLGIWSQWLPLLHRRVGDGWTITETRRTKHGREGDFCRVDILPESREEMKYMFKVGDRVKVLRSGERGILVAIESYGQCRVVTPSHPVPSVENIAGLDLVPVTVIEGLIGYNQDGVPAMVTKDGALWPLAGYGGKRVRITIETLDDGDGG